jgi:phosphoribosylanthranilate isomerase
MWVKICGIRDAQTAELVCQLGPDAIGLNFHPPSSRFLSDEAARRIGDLPTPGVQRVGVFVNHSAAEIEDRASACRLDAIQFHGDETPAQLAEVAGRLPGISLLRAWRMSGETLAGLNDYLTECRRLNVPILACLVDSLVPGTYGGTGHQVSWTALAREYRSDAWPPLVLAGGLTPMNVSEAIAIVRPWGVDTASGVESEPGVKDLERVRRFISNARSN